MPGQSGDGPRRRPLLEDAAHSRPRDAYREVPILARPTWGHEIAAYFFFGGISAGATLIGSLAELVGGPRLRTLARVAHLVGFAALLPCPPLLIDDLGRPERFHHMLRVFKPMSPMNVGSWTLAIHGAVSAAIAAHQLAAAKPVPWLTAAAGWLPGRLLAALGVGPAVALGGYTGVLLGTTSVPVWAESRWLGGLFMASAIGAGTAATNLAGAAGGMLEAPAEEALGTIGVCTGVAELGLTAAYIATSGPAASALLEGDGLALTVAGVGLTAAGVLLEASIGRAGWLRRPLTALASLAALGGGAALRWGVVRAGQASAADRETLLELQRRSPDARQWHA
jgi:formate-dependent nitrite reductase membrane component NrfD